MAPALEAWEESKESLGLNGLEYLRKGVLVLLMWEKMLVKKAQGAAHKNFTTRINSLELHRLEYLSKVQRGIPLLAWSSKVFESIGRKLKWC